MISFNFTSLAQAGKQDGNGGGGGTTLFARIYYHWKTKHGIRSLLLTVKAWANGV